MDINEIQALERRPSTLGGVGYAVVGVAVVVAAVWLLQAASAYQFDGPPTCDGQQMAREDVCLQFGAGKSFDYETGVRQQQAWGQTWRLLLGMLLGGVGAAVLGGAAAWLSDRRPRAAYLACATVLGASAGYLLSLGTAIGVTGAIGAPAGAVLVLTGSSDERLVRGTVYLAGVGLLPVAALLVTSAASYRPAGQGYGLHVDDPLHLFVMELVQQHGDWVRLLLALAAVVGGTYLVTAAVRSIRQAHGRRVAGVLVVVASGVANVATAYALLA